MKSNEATKAKAKELGIQSWHVKSQETLAAEIEELEPVIVVKEVSKEPEPLPKFRKNGERIRLCKDGVDRGSNRQNREFDSGA